MVRTSDRMDIFDGRRAWSCDRARCWRRTHSELSRFVGCARVFSFLVSRCRRQNRNEEKWKDIAQQRKKCLTMTLAVCREPFTRSRTRSTQADRVSFLFSISLHFSQLFNTFENVLFFSVLSKWTRTKRSTVRTSRLKWKEEKILRLLMFSTERADENNSAAFSVCARARSCTQFR